MLDIRAVAYIAPVSEVDFAPVPLTVRLVNYADETGLVSAGFRIYNDSTGLLIYQSDIIPVEIAKGETVDVSALTDFMPPSPADDTYFVLFDGNAANALVPDGIAIHLGSMYFDVKPAPLGPIPAGHHVTHEDTGIDEVDVTGLAGLLADPQTPILHSGTHALPSPDAVYVDFLAALETHTYFRLSPDGAGGAKWNSDVEKHHTNHETGGGDEVDHAKLIHLTTGDPHTQYQLENAQLTSIITSATPQTLTDQASIDWDLDLGGAAEVTLGGNRTLNAPTNMVNGSRHSLRIIQDGAGTRTLAFNAAFLWPRALPPHLTTTAGASDLVTFYCDGTNMIATAAVFDVR